MKKMIQDWRRVFTSNNEETSIYKGIFTPWKTGKCPPWSIKADEIIHKKQKKTIEYKCLARNL